MDIERCKCGKSQIIFDCVGEDLFSARCENVTKKENNNEGSIEYFCDCGEFITYADKMMMV